MAWSSGLRRWVSIAAAVSLAVTAAALIVALAAEVGGRATSRELSQRLVPAAAGIGVLLGQYSDQQTALRNYVTSGQAAQLRPFTQAAAQIPGQQAKVAALVRPYPLMAHELAVAVAAQRAWRARVAGPQLAATAHRNFARARALQADIPVVRRYVLAVRSPIVALQAQIASRQGRVVARLISGQQRLLGSLVAVCAVVAVIAVGGVVVVRRWLLTPFAALRAAAESVAAGQYDTRVPAVGPAELADLGRSADLMRTRLLAALAEAQRAEERFRGLFDAAPDATLTVAVDGSIAMVNAQAVRMFGYGAGELVGQPVEVLVPAAARSAYPSNRDGYFADPATRPMGAGLELYAVRKDGREFRVEVTLSSLPAKSGVMATVTVRDISERLAAQAERERLELRLRQSERLDSLGQLVGGIAHDFNNLLNVITGYTDFAEEELTGLAGRESRMESVLADIEQVRQAARRAVGLTRQLMVFARREVVHPQVVDLDILVSGVQQMLGSILGEHVEMVIVPGAGVWTVKADPGQLEQILVNLALNARDAMPGGGKLTIDTGNVDADEAYTASRPDLRPGRYVRLRVSDTGTGMSREVLARAFEPFFSTKPKDQGTGLGLATVYGIVTQAGGYAQIYSEPGHGTSVSAMLPASDEAASTTTSVPVTVPAPGRGETILLVEDEKSLRDLSRRILVRNGYQVYPAADSADALRHASDLQQPIDLLLTDLIMPDMLGNEVAVLARAVRPGLQVLFMSGYAPPVLYSQGALDPYIDLLEKPFSETTILARVRRAIDSGGAPGERATPPGL